MNNWRLLLLVVVAVLQTKPSFAEGDVLDERQCCDRRSKSLLPFTDSSIRSIKAATEDRRLSRDGIHKKRQLEASISRRSVNKDRRRILDSASQSRTQLRHNRISLEASRVDVYPSVRNNRDTRYFEYDNQRLSRENFLKSNVRRQYERGNPESRIRSSQDDTSGTRFGNQRARNTKNAPNERIGYEFRRELDDTNILRSVSNDLNLARRVTLKDNTRDSENMERRAFLERRSRDSVIKSRRSASLPSTRINNNKLSEETFRDDNRGTSPKRRQTTGRIDERRHQRNEQIMANLNSGRQNYNRVATRSLLRDFMDKSRNRNMDRYNEITIRLEKQGMDTRRMLTGTDRVLVLRQDTEQNRRSQSKERVDYNARAMELTRSMEDGRDVSRMHIKHETKERTKKRETINERSQKLKTDGVRDIFNTYQQRDQKENKTRMSWHTVLYALQGLYLCCLLMQIINVDASEKRKSRNFSWWSPCTNFVKVD